MPAFTEKQMLKVELGDRSYPIEIGKGCIDSLIAFKNKLIEGRRRVAVVVDAGLAESHPTTIGKFSHDIPTLKIPIPFTKESCITELNILFPSDKCQQ